VCAKKSFVVTRIMAGRCHARDDAAVRPPSPATLDFRIGGWAGPRIQLPFDRAFECNASSKPSGRAGPLDEPRCRLYRISWRIIRAPAVMLP